MPIEPYRQWGYYAYPGYDGRYLEPRPPGGPGSWQEPWRYRDRYYDGPGGEPWGYPYPDYYAYPGWGYRYGDPMPYSGLGGGYDPWIYSDRYLDLDGVDPWGLGIWGGYGSWWADPWLREPWPYDDWIGTWIW